MLFVAAGGVLFWPTLAPGYWAFGTDTIAHDLICVAHGWSRWQIDGGAIPWFDPYLRAGQPSLGSAAFMPFYPPNWLSGAAVASAGAPWADGQIALETPQVGAIFLGGGWNLPRAHTLQWPLHLAFGAWFLCMAVRARGGSWLAGALAGFIFGFSGHVATLTYAGHLAKVQAIAWLPALVWSLEVRGSRRRPSAYLAASVALSMCWLAGHPQIWIYGAALALALEAVRAWASTPDAKFSHRAKAVLRGVVLAVGVVALSLMLAAPMSLAVAEFAPWSNRASQTYEDAIKSSYPPEELWELVVPRAAGDSVSPGLGGTGSYRGRWGERIVSDYLGLPAILLALAGLFFGARRSRWFWTAVFGATTLLCQGGYLGGAHRLLYDWLPGFKMFRSPATMMVLLPLSAGMLAADGLDALRTRESFPRRRVWAFGLLAFALVVATLSPLPRWTLETFGGNAFAEAQLEAHQSSKRHASIAGLLAVALAGAWLALKKRPGASSRWGLALAVVTVALVAADAGVATRFFIRPAPVQAFSPAIEQHRGLLKLREEFDRRQGDRPPPFPPGIMQRGREMSLWPMLAGWRVPHGYHPITYAALEDQMQKLGHDSEAFLRGVGVAAVIEGASVRWLEPLDANVIAEKSADQLSGGDVRLALAPADEWLLNVPGDSAWRVRDDKLTIEPQGLANVIRAHDTQAGETAATLEFRPWSRRLGPALMALSWLGVLLGAVWLERRKRTSENTPV
jgi:hypothetical protein